MNIQKLFKSYVVRRKNGQCQVLIPLVELDELCEKIEGVLSNKPLINQSKDCAKNATTLKPKGKNNKNGAGNGI